MKLPVTNVALDSFVQRCGPFVEASQHEAYNRLLVDVLEIAPFPPPRPTDPWVSFSLFDAGGACVANVDVAILSMSGSALDAPVAAIRCVAVAPQHRGKGLFRALMRDALTWCDARADTTILYTAEPALYARDGFEIVPQHTFLGTAPLSARAPDARRLDMDVAEDRALTIARLQARAPLSRRFALTVDVDTCLRNLRDPDLTIVELARLAAILVYEGEADTLTLYDVIAERTPALEEILASLDEAPKVVRTLFAPDALGWDGTPMPEETGLMARGHWPDAWRTPFMIPPTAEF